VFLRCFYLCLVVMSYIHRSIIAFNPPWISPLIWKEMVESWLDVNWKKRSSVAKGNRTTKENFMVYHGGSKSIAAYKDEMVLIEFKFNFNFYLPINCFLCRIKKVGRTHVGQMCT